MSEVRELTHSLSARGRPLIGDSEEASAIAEAIGLSMAAAGGRSA